MPGFTTNPFDDASGHAFLKWFLDKGGLPGEVKEVIPEGTTLETALQIGLGVTFVRTATAGDGVRLPAGAPVGSLVIVANAASSDAIKLFPATAEESADILFGTAAGVARDVSSSSIAFSIKASNEGWIGWSY